MSRELLRVIGAGTFTIIGLSVAAYFIFGGAPQPEADQFWDVSAEGNTAVIDHSDWQYLLEEYVISDDPSGVNLVDYQNLLEDDKAVLDRYIDQLSSIDPRTYNRTEQHAYWINLYNALTVQLIIENYPAESITKLGASPLSFGPWDDNIITLAETELSLNDIEHGILRPLWNDYRVHFAVNCASIGCPNLQAMAFTADNSEALLDQAAGEYLAHPRGARFEDGTLILSSIFDWYGIDFGDDQGQVLETLSQHAPSAIANELAEYADDITYEYNWQLNDF